MINGIESIDRMPDQGNSASEAGCIKGLFLLIFEGLVDVIGFTGTLILGGLIGFFVAKLALTIFLLRRTAPGGPLRQPGERRGSMTDDESDAGMEE